MRPQETPPTAFGRVLAEYMKAHRVSGPAELAMLVREKAGTSLSEEVLIEHMRGKQEFKDPTLAHRVAEVLGLESTEQARLSAAYLFGLDIWRASTRTRGTEGKKRRIDGRTDKNLQRSCDISG
jgi:hypothetical protein